jgi:hypothetical protein
MRNRLCHSAAWFNLTAEQRSAYEKSMPFQRTARSDYGSSLGNWHSDLYYASSGTVMSRQTFKLFGT